MDQSDPESTLFKKDIFGFSNGMIKCSFNTTFEQLQEISNNVVCATSKASDQPAHTHSLIRAFASRLNIIQTVKLLTKIHLEFLSLKGGCTGSSESTHVKMPHCWKSQVMANLHMRV